MQIAGFEIKSQSTQQLTKLIAEKFSHYYERRAGLSLTGVSARNYHHWKEQGLIEGVVSDKQNREWVRLNVYDFVWVKVIQIMREFGVPLFIITLVKHKLWLSLLDIEMDEETFIATNNLPGLTRQVQLEQYRLIEHLKKEKASIPDEQVVATTFFGILVNSVLFEERTVNLIVAKDHDDFRFDVFSDSPKLGSGNVTSWQQLPHLSVPLNSILNQFFEMPENEANLIQWQFIDYRESQVLKAVREGKFKQVIVTPKDKSEKLFIEITDTEEARNEKAKHLIRLLGLKEYREVRLIYRNDKHLVIKKKKRI
ncbi:MAG: hypothetical protein K1X81_01690 [Bacteroidia bacterium]|nr:hypothetical protein [Bacteroidia bacterium]